MQRQNKTRHIKRCAGGGTGGRVCLRGISEFYWVQVQVLSGAQKILKIRNDFQDFAFLVNLKISKFESLALFGFVGRAVVMDFLDENEIAFFVMECVG